MIFFVRRMAFAWMVAGCAAKSDGAGGTSGTEPAASSVDVSSTGFADASTSTGGVDSSSGEERVEFGSAEEEEDDGTGGSVEGCINGDIPLENVVVELTTNRLLGEDVVAEFDRARGSRACLQLEGEWVVVHVTLGPFDFAEPRTSLRVRVGDGVRAYDLATDPGPPAQGDPGVLRLSNNYQQDSATTLGFDTINQGATGTLTVVALPIDGATELDLTAVGEIAAPDGWQFDLHLSATLP